MKKPQNLFFFAFCIGAPLIGYACAQRKIDPEQVCRDKYDPNNNNASIFVEHVKTHDEVPCAFACFVDQVYKGDILETDNVSCTALTEEGSHVCQSGVCVSTVAINACKEQHVNSTIGGALSQNCRVACKVNKVWTFSYIDEGKDCFNDHQRKNGVCSKYHNCLVGDEKDPEIFKKTHLAVGLALHGLN